MIELDWTSAIEVSHHARDRSRERLGWDDAQDIRAEVRDALLFNRVADHVPNWTRGIGHSGRREGGLFYVWNEAATRCWVLAKHGKTLCVATLLLDRDTETAAGERRHLRRGFAAG